MMAEMKEIESRISSAEGLRQIESRISSAEGLRQIESRISSAEGLRQIESRISSAEGLRQIESRISSAEGLRQIESRISSAEGGRPKSVTFAAEPVFQESLAEEVEETEKMEDTESNDSVSMAASNEEPALVDLETEPPTDTTSLILTDAEPDTGLSISQTESIDTSIDELPSVTEYKTPIHSLPDETLDHIFCFLDIKQRIRIEAVCTRWRNISRNQPWKWPKKLVLDSESSLKTTLLTDSILSSVVSRCGTNLKKLTLTIYGRSNRVLAWGSSSTVRSQNSVVLSEKALGIIAKCINLVEMKLLGIPITDNGLEELSKGCTHLKFVTLQDSKFSDEGLHTFFGQCNMIEGLEIVGNDRVKGDCFKAISKNLLILHLHDSQSLQISLVLQNVMVQCNLLQELRITQCDILMDQLTLSKLCNKYQDTLKILHLDGYDRNSQLSQKIQINWCQVMGLLRGLQELSLRNCDDVGDNLMNVIAKNCLKLSVLNVSGTRVTDEGLRNLASAPSLKVLDISDVSGINGEGLDVLAGQGRLEEVFARHNHMISPDESCSTLALFCPSFKVLDVSETMGVSSMLITAFCICIKRGFVKGPIKLIVGGTAIRRSVETCDQLQVIYQNTCKQHVLFDLLSNYEDSDSDGSDW